MSIRQAVSDPIGELQALGLAWARFAPTLVIVPAFGLRALPVLARVILGLALSTGIFPALVPIIVERSGTPWVVLALEQSVLGLPVALAAAIPLWGATTAGGVVDALRSAHTSLGLAVVERSKSTPLAILVSLLASMVFIKTGGSAWVATSLATTTLPEPPLLAAWHALVAGIGLAIAIGAPVLLAGAVFEVAFALIAHATAPSQLHALLAPIRARGLLGVVTVVIYLLAAAIALVVRGSS